MHKFFAQPKHNIYALESITILIESELKSKLSNIIPIPVIQTKPKCLSQYELHRHNSIKIVKVIPIYCTNYSDIHVLEPKVYSCNCNKLFVCKKASQNRKWGQTDWNASTGSTWDCHSNKQKTSVHPISH